MQVFPFVVVVWILAVGLYGVVTSRDLIHLIMCLIVVQSSTYVLLLGVGYVTGAVAPYFYDVPVHTPAVDPVVQALALTDVVVEAAVTALLLAIAIQAHKRFGTLDPHELVQRKGGREPAARAGRGGAAAHGGGDHRAEPAAAPAPATTGRRRHRDQRRRDSAPGGGHGQGGPWRGRLLVRRVPAIARGGHRHRLRGRTAQRRPGLPGRAAGHRGHDVLLAVLRAGGDLLPRAHAHVPGRHGRVLPDRRHLRPVRVVRAHGSVGLRADRLPARGARAAPGGAELRHHQQRGRLPVPVGHRPDLRAHRRAEHGPDRHRHRPAPARRAGHRGVPAHHHRAADQGRHRAVPPVAARRARGRAHPGLRAVLRRDGGARAVRGGPRLLVGVRRRARPPGRHYRRPPGPGPSHRGDRRGVLLPWTAHQADAGLPPQQPRRDVPGRHRA